MQFFCQFCEFRVSKRLIRRGVGKCQKNDTKSRLPRLTDLTDWTDYDAESGIMPRESSEPCFWKIRDDLRESSTIFFCFSFFLSEKKSVFLLSGWIFSELSVILIAVDGEKPAAWCWATASTAPVSGLGGGFSFCLPDRLRFHGPDPVPDGPETVGPVRFYDRLPYFFDFSCESVIDKTLFMKYIDMIENL